VAAPGIEELYPVLGHDFARPELLREGLTHPSAAADRRASAGNYDRLEFLGDRVLGVIVAERLLRQFPDAPAGELARRYNALVRRESLAGVARAIGLGRHVRMSKSERATGGEEKSALLADACEAVIAALYLDGGMEAAARFVDRYWKALMDEAGTADKDPKTALQEWAHQTVEAPPTYAVIGREGPPHEPTFTVEVTIEGATGRRLSATGTGGSKRAAEQAAAGAMLEAVGRSEPDRGAGRG